MHNMGLKSWMIFLIFYQNATKLLSCHHEFTRVGHIVHGIPEDYLVILFIPWLKHDLNDKVKLANPIAVLIACKHARVKELL